MNKTDLDRYITGNYGEAQFNNEEECDVCGQSLDECDCPECPICTQIGDPACYQEVDLGICGGLYGTKERWITHF